MLYSNSYYLGIGDWGLGIGPIPNPQSPIPINIMIQFYKILNTSIAINILINLFYYTIY